MTGRLAELEAPLDRSRLHVFVAGPGFGEGIAVALPGRGWVLVDGCRTGGEPGRDLPLLSVLSRWRNGVDDGVVWLILTHPHDDHADGFAEVLDSVHPWRIGLMGPPPPARHLLDVIRSAGATKLLTEERLRVQQVLAAARAMETWEHTHGRVVEGLADGFDLGLPTVQATVRAPDGTLGAALLGHGWPRIRHRANELSLVIELVFNGARVVLGGDLPRVWRTGRGRTKPVATGWNQVMSMHPQLATLHGLKVPHHGSRDALHAELVVHAHPTALWITPYSKSRLPSADHGHGLQRLLGQHPSVMLTALPTRRDHQPVHAHPARVARATYAALVSAPSDTGFASGAIDTRPTSIDDPLAPIWATALDNTGNLVGSWRGDVALEVVP